MSLELSELQFRESVGRLSKNDLIASISQMYETLRGLKAAFTGVGHEDDDLDDDDEFLDGDGKRERRHTFNLGDPADALISGTAATAPNSPASFGRSLPGPSARTPSALLPPSATAVARLPRDTPATVTPAAASAVAPVTAISSTTAVPTTLGQAGPAPPKSDDGQSAPPPTALLDITDLVSANISPSKVIQRVMESTLHLIPAEAISMYLSDESSNQLVCQASSNHGLISLKVPRTKGCAGFVATTGRDVCVHDVPRNWLHDRKADVRPGVTVRSCLMMPIRNQHGTTIGVIEAINPIPAHLPFSDTDIQLLKSVSQSVGIVLRTAHLEELARSRHLQTQALIQISELTSSEFGIERVIEKITRASHVVVQAESIELFMIDPASGELVNQKSAERFPPGKGIIGHVAATGRLVNISDKEHDWRFEDTLLPESMKVSTVLAVPIKDYQARTVAVIRAINKHGSTVNDSSDGSRTEDDADAKDDELDAPAAAEPIAASPPAFGHPPSSADASLLSVNPDEVVADVARAATPKPQRLRKVERFTLEDQNLLTALSTTAASILYQAQLYDEAVRRQNQTKALLQITELMSAEIGTEMVVPRIIEASYMLVPCDRITLFTVEECDEMDEEDELFANDDGKEDSDEDEPRKCLMCRISKDQGFQGAKIGWGKGIVGHVAMTCQWINIPDAYSDSRFDPTSDRETGFVTKSILTVPVMDRQHNVVAVIQAVNKKGHPAAFTEEDINILQNLATTAGIILQKTKLYEKAVVAERKATALMSLLKVSTNKEASMENTIDGIVSVAYEVLNADRVTIYFVDKDEVFSVICKDQKSWSLPIGKGIAGSVAKYGQKINLADAYDDVRFDRTLDKKTGYRTKSVLAVPVKDYDGKVIAIVQALNKMKEPTRSSGSALVSSSREQQRLAAVKLKKKKTKFNEKNVIAFTREDEEMLSAFCVEIRATIRSYLSDAVIEHYTRHDENVFSVLEVFTDHSIASAPASRIKQMLRPNQSQSFIWPQALESKLTIQDMDSLKFNVFKYSEDDLLSFTIEIFQAMGLTEEFQIPLDTLQNFVLAVRAKYRKNPFHNWYHGFSVLHFAFYFLRKTNAHSDLTKLDVLGLLVACLCHDADHPGRTNSFEVQTSSQLALLHNDRSVLENHHAVTTFQILQDDKCDILKHLMTRNRQAVRTTIINAILATDMTVHFAAIKDLGSRDPLNPFNIASPKDRQMLVDTITHAADLSGQVFPISVAKVWEERISQEFGAQAEDETKRGLNPAQFMLGLADPHTRAKCQQSFICFVLDPWWKNVADLYGELRPCYDTLQKNRFYYEGLMKFEESPRVKSMRVAQSHVEDSEDEDNGDIDDGDGDDDDIKSEEDAKVDDGSADGDDYDDDEA